MDLNSFFSSFYGNGQQQGQPAARPQDAQFGPAAPQNYSSLSDMYTSQAAQAAQPQPAPQPQANLMGNTAAPSPAPAPAPVASGGGSPWSFSNGGLTRQEGLTAPTYNDVFTNFLGNNYMTGYDPALAMTLNAGGQGSTRSGLGAFLTQGNNAFQAANSQIQGGASYNDQDMLGLARGLGIDTGGRTGRQLQDFLDPQLQDYMMIGGLSSGWNPSSDSRQANGTIYKREGGKLVPYQTQGYHAREVGNYVQENPGVLAPLAVVGAGLLAPAAAGASAGTSGAAAGAAGAGTAGTAGASTGWLGSLANYAGLGSQFGALPAYAQAGLQGALQGAATSGLTGGNPLLGAVTGGITGGFTPGVNSALSGLGGLPSYATNAVGAAGLGALSTGISGGNPLIGALGAGVGSGVGGGLQYAGVNGGLANIAGSLSGRTASGLAQGRDLSEIFSPQQLAMLAANPNTLRALFR